MAQLSQYVKGRSAENYLRDVCEAKGYAVIRSAQSKGSADLIAGDGIQVILLQAKAWDSKLAKLNKEEEGALMAKAKMFKAVPVFARKNQGRWEFLRLNETGYYPFVF